MTNPNPCRRDRSWWAANESDDVCRACGRPVHEHDAPATTDRPAWTYAAENLPAAREAGYDV